MKEKGIGLRNKREDERNAEKRWTGSDMIKK